MSKPRFAIRRPLDKAQALDLYRQGLCDKEIADGCGVTKGCIVEWRKRRGLNPNKKPIPVHELSQISKDAREARKQGLNYGMYKAQQFEAIQTARTAWQRRLET